MCVHCVIVIEYYSRVTSSVSPLESILPLQSRAHPHGESGPDAASRACAHYITSLQRDWPRASLRPAAAQPPQQRRRQPPHIDRPPRARPVVRARLLVPCTGGPSPRTWPRARRTRRARPSSSTANTSSTMACGCRPSAGGRWRRSPTSP